MKPSLPQAFAFGIGAVALVLAAGLWALFSATHTATLRTAEALRAARAQKLEDQVDRELLRASRAVDDLTEPLLRGLVAADDRGAVEDLLLAALARDGRLSEATFTRAAWTDFSAEGEAQLAPEPRWQASALRRADGGLETRIVAATSPSSGYSLQVADRGADWRVAIRRRVGPAADPTGHPTFQTSASREVGGKAIWSDLSWAQDDAGLPETERRVVVTVQRAIRDPSGSFVGVVKAGLHVATLDSLAAPVPGDPHRVFLADGEGRLVARLDPRDGLVATDDGLRAQPVSMPPAIAAALGSALWSKADETGEERSGELRVAGERWLVTVRPLQLTQGWLVGIVVPEAAYTREQRLLRRNALIAASAVALLVLLGGLLMLGALRSALGQIARATARMQALDFTPTPTRAAFRDVQLVADELERAKTAARALGRYVPLDLVRRLYRENREPVPGGELRELTLLFTDLEGFTGFGERLEPGALARALGAYLGEMARAVQACDGTVDKYIGDAVMAFWNAPEPCPQHAQRACAAVLECREAARRAFASPAWGGLPPLRTRFGLHTGEAMVGHFGSADRLSYTALGDTVNLASRLEGLCKLYGVDVLASEAVVERARAAFAFRTVDRVAVKGRAGGVLVFELLGKNDDALPGLSLARAYEAALAAYFDRDFAAAIRRLEPLLPDGPSQVLLERCRAFARSPPPAGWTGVYTATVK